MDRSARCVLFEPQPCWAPRLRGLAPMSSVGFIEVRVASEVTKLLSEESRRMLLVALRSSMSAPQCAARLRQAAATRDRWPACQVMLLVDERMEAWHRACWEMGSGLVLVGTKSLPSLARTLNRFLAELPTSDDNRDVEQDPWDWLPW